MPETFRDLDGNFVFDPRNEKRKAWDVAAAITLPKKGTDEGRAVVVADSDAFTDLALDASSGNRAFAVDGVRWLLGEESLGAPGGETTSPSSTPADRRWPGSTSPSSSRRSRCSGRGFWVTRRRKAPMRGRPVRVQAALAAGALALAAVVWLRPPPQGAPGEVPVAPLARGEVRAVHWDDGSHQVDVFRGADSDRAVWVRIATSPSLQAPDAGVRPTPG